MTENSMPLPEDIPFCERCQIQHFSQQTADEAHAVMDELEDAEA